ncbi:MAG: hypothetical protein KGJ29_09980, partial [Hyphomicrobiales bacterium]|nr:hypothetical protein [Hyphomicrobiales bacterium]
MSSDGPPKFGEEEANALLAAGWRQGAVFKPFGDLRPKNDEYFFVVCTQSCSVVSPNLIRDPFVEIAEGKPLQHYKKNSPEAIGKNVTKFQMPVTNDQFAALEVDINTRRFVA